MSQPLLQLLEPPPPECCHMLPLTCMLLSRESRCHVTFLCTTACCHSRVRRHLCARCYQHKEKSSQKDGSRTHRKPEEIHDSERHCSGTGKLKLQSGENSKPG